MAPRPVRLHPIQAAGPLRAMAPTAKRKVKQAIDRLAQDPSGKTTGLDVKRLRASSQPPLYRVRVGDWRVVWQLRDGVIEVLKVFHRSEGYAWLDRRYPPSGAT